MTMRVLLIGGYKPLMNALQRGMQEEGFSVDLHFQEKNGDNQTPTIDYDAIILDLHRPGDNGLSFIKRWREAGVKTQVLVLTPQSINDSHCDLKLGIDDWLVKPFALEEFFSRLRALVHSA